MPPSPASAGTPSPSASRTRSPGWPWFLVADLVLVVVFAAIGRSSHGEDAAAALVTAWPFLAGAVVGWLAGRVWHRPAAVWPAGVTVWLSTEIVGMVLRALTGQGTAWSFVLVSLAVLGVFLLGYRAILRLVRNSRRAR